MLCGRHSGGGPVEDKKEVFKRIPVEDFIRKESRQCM